MTKLQAPVRDIEVTFLDGSVRTYTTASFPWVYREWVVIADLDEKRRYLPVGNVESYREV